MSGSVLMRLTRTRPARAAAVVITCGGLLTACAGDSTGLGLNLVPEEQVRQMGQQTWAQIRSETPVSNNQTYQRAAQQVSYRLLRAGGMNPQAWEVVVFQGDEANAFALPNGKIGVYEGMFGMAENEAQLAAVIAHEIAHNEENHAAERVNTQAATSAGVQIASAAAGIAGIDAQTAAALLGAGAQYGLNMPYSRNQELEADRLGLNMMARAGYDPRAAVELWQRMAQRGGGPPAFLSTHPAPQQRIEQLQQMMPQALEIYQARS
ncbi:M48 family metallopeptidase [Caenispirillum salinarum]|uniref:M48 family metallopeptidase n=1 Tax=Caenispirillum salinarum TaxID=859058 RepID=UPI00384D48A2